IRIKTGVIWRSFKSVNIEKRCNLFHFLPTQAVDDSRLTLVFFQELNQLLLRLFLGPDFVVNVLSVERRHENISILHLKVLLNVQLNLRSSCCRQCDDWEITKVLNHRFNPAILRTEVVSPLGDTVSLINSNKRDVDFLKKINCLFFIQRFRSDVKKFHDSVHAILLQTCDLAFGKSGVEKASINAISVHLINLILHQSDER